MRLIDADAYCAEMKTRQDACKEEIDNAIAREDWELYDKISRAYAAFTEAKLTLDNMPTVPAAPRWVRCEEEMPQMLYQAEGDDFCIDYSLLVLAYREKSHDFYLARLMDDGHGATFGTDGFDELYGVTHWMPLPEPPKEGA